MLKRKEMTSGVKIQFNDILYSPTLGFFGLLKKEIIELVRGGTEHPGILQSGTFDKSNTSADLFETNVIFYPGSIATVVDKVKQMGSFKSIKLSDATGNVGVFFWTDVYKNAKKI